MGSLSNSDRAGIKIFPKGFGAFLRKNLDKELESIIYYKRKVYMYELEACQDLFAATTSIINRYKGRLIDSLTNPYVTEKIKEKENILKNLSKSFNIFTSISNLYRKENFHSEILKTILDPNTTTIGNIAYLKAFVASLQTTSGKTIDYCFSDNKEDIKIIVENSTEDGRIDLFIHDDKCCIIIENKINNAPDMRNQLARYVEYAHHGGYEIKAIVYIPLYYKEPPIKTYDNEFTKFNDEIEKKLVILPAKELAECFLDNCKPDNEDAKVYIKHYANLVKNLGGNSMTNKIDRDLLEEMFKSHANIDAAKNIANIWNARVTLAGEILAEELLTLNFKRISANIVSKELPGGYLLVFQVATLILGIAITETEKEKKGGNLITILNEVLSDYFPNISGDSNTYKPWVWDGRIVYNKVFDLNGYEEPIEKLKEYIVSRFKLLEERLKSS
jgi:hypothetical protein